MLLPLPINAKYAGFILNAFAFIRFIAPNSGLDCFWNYLELFHGLI